MNILYSCCHKELWLDVAKKLEVNKGLKNVGFIARKSELTEVEYKKHFPNSDVFWLEDLWHGFKYKLNDGPHYLDEDEYKKISFELLNLIKMTDRIFPRSSSYNMSFADKEYWLINMIETWRGYLVEKKVDVIVSPSIPHRIFDYALYIASILTNAKFITFQQTSFDSQILPITKIESMDGFDMNYGEGFVLDEVNAYLDSLKGEYEGAEPDYMVRQKNEQLKSQKLFEKLKRSLKLLSRIREFGDDSHSYRIHDNSTPMKSRMTKAQRYISLLKGRNYKNKLREALDSKTVSMESLGDAKYVLVALHYQPEETSCPTGGFYSEQRAIVKQLLMAVPEDVLIVVKEHSTQFIDSFEGEAGRSLDFYSSLLELSSRVRLIDPAISSFELIDKTIAVVTVSGTIGWEAVCRGKPVLTFGRAWYEGMESVYTVKSKGDIKNIWQKMVSTPIDEQQVISFCEDLGKRSIKARHYENSVGISDSAKESSVEKIVFAIDKLTR